MGAAPSIEQACAERLPHDVLKIIAAKYSEQYYPEYWWVENNKPCMIHKLMNCRYYTYPVYLDKYLITYIHSLDHRITIENPNEDLPFTLIDIHYVNRKICETPLYNFVHINFNNSLQKDVRQLLKIAFMIIYKHVDNKTEFMNEKFMLYNGLKNLKIKDIIKLYKDRARYY